MEIVLLTLLTLLVIMLVLVELLGLRLPLPRRRAATATDSGLGLEDVIQSITDDIVKSQKRIQEGSRKSIFYVDRAQVTIGFVVKKSVSGSVRLMAVEGTGEYGTEQVHQVTVDLTTTPPLVGKLIETVVAKHDNIDDAVLDLEKLLSQDATTFLTQYQQAAGE